MQLNYEFHPAAQASSKTPLLLIHGLFGSLSNLGMIARAFQQQHDVIRIDLRNHGQSSHHPDMNYQLMAQDVEDTLDLLKIDQFAAIGHSMGAKVSMQLAAKLPSRIQQLIVLDMAPYAYQENHHDQIFKALFAVQNAHIESRKEATLIMQQHIKDEMVIQFLLKSFQKGHWLFNVDALFKHYGDIISWYGIETTDIATLFIRGGNSPYICDEYHINAIEQQFKYAQLKTIENAGHWLHAEKTDQVNRLIEDFLNN